MSDELLKPGNITPDSGQYELTGPRGGSKGREITSIEGKPLPPTPEKNQRYKPVDLTKHKGK
jgi:hypothetical protein